MKKDAQRLAIGEAPGTELDKENWYPPNAFHTYWTLELLFLLESSHPDSFAQIRTNFAADRFAIDRIRAEMLLWARKTAGVQIALHSAESSKLDSDQLAWSLATLMKFEEDFQANLEHQDFIRHGLKCLFEAQTPVGIWKTGAPLFHYLRSGNAYCYIFETFTVLLKTVMTNRKEGIFLRSVLRPYARRLLSLWKYAKLTEIPLSENENRINGWSSGHRANRKKPESWATASVYSYLQCLRRLTGVWAREAAAEQLRVVALRGSAEAAEKTLTERGDSWAAGKATAANQMMTLFVNPRRCYGSGDDLEPDGQPIGNDQARAAILFGPPGTSKTTLARSIANAIGWDYVELHSSHFVADGLPNVQKTADSIFKKLMQLDRTVILFDEIDELVRARDSETDAFGRFLTTSMLPKLAELWNSRKVIYFVATNHIEFFDTAVTRAQRFDALIHVAPPSFDRKIQELTKFLSTHSIPIASITFTRQDVEDALIKAVGVGATPVGPHDVAKSDELPAECVMAKFLLMRYDQIEELVFAIRNHKHEKDDLTLDVGLMSRALSELRDPALKRLSAFKHYAASRSYEQHDFSKATLWRIQTPAPDVKKFGGVFGKDQQLYFNDPEIDQAKSNGCSFTLIGPGVANCVDQ